MSDLGNGGRPNSMKLGEDFDLDELLLDIQFYLSSFYLPFTFSGGGVLFWGLRVQKNTHMRGNFRVPLQ